MSSTTSTASFIPSSKFAGKKDGYVFKTGESGLGYYRDRYNPYLSGGKRPPNEEVISL
jgi:hypothetical protein